jgi:hypothetical protein
MGSRRAKAQSWNAPAAAILQGGSRLRRLRPRKSVPIAAAYLQGDNNDDYVVAVSEDGNSFRELWVARPVGPAGLARAGRRTAWTGRGAGSGWRRAAATASTR